MGEVYRARVIRLELRRRFCAVWRSNGRKLFFVTGESLVAVEVKATGSTVEANCRSRSSSMEWIIRDIR